MYHYYWNPWSELINNQKFKGRHPPSTKLSLNHKSPTKYAEETLEEGKKFLAPKWHQDLIAVASVETRHLGLQNLLVSLEAVMGRYCISCMTSQYLPCITVKKVWVLGETYKQVMQTTITQWTKLNDSKKIHQTHKAKHLIVSLKTKMWPEAGFFLIDFKYNMSFLSAFSHNSVNLVGERNLKLVCRQAKEV